MKSDDEKTAEYKQSPRYKNKERFKAEYNRLIQLPVPSHRPLSLADLMFVLEHCAGLEEDFYTEDRILKLRSMLIP